MQVMGWGGDRQGRGGMRRVLNSSAQAWPEERGCHQSSKLLGQRPISSRTSLAAPLTLHAAPIICPPHPPFTTPHPCVHVDQAAEEGADQVAHRLPLLHLPSAALQVLKQIAPARKLLNHVHVLLVLKGGVQPDHVLVLKGDVDADLSLNLVSAHHEAHHAPEWGGGMRTMQLHTMHQGM